MDEQRPENSVTDWEDDDVGRPVNQREPGYWNLLLLLFAVQSIALVWWGLFQLTIFAQTMLAPQKQFGQNVSNLGEVFMTCPIFFPALAIGLMVANMRAWLIPSMRAALNRQAALRQEPEFSASMKQLAITAAILMALAVPLSLLGAVDFFQ